MFRDGILHVRSRSSDLPLRDSGSQGSLSRSGVWTDPGQVGGQEVSNRTPRQVKQRQQRANATGPQGQYLPLSSASSGVPSSTNQNYQSLPRDWRSRKESLGHYSPSREAVASAVRSQPLSNRMLRDQLAPSLGSTSSLPRSRPERVPDPMDRPIPLSEADPYYNTGDRARLPPPNPVRPAPIAQRSNLSSPPVPREAAEGYLPIWQITQAPPANLAGRYENMQPPKPPAVPQRRSASRTAGTESDDGTPVPPKVDRSTKPARRRNESLGNASTVLPSPGPKLQYELLSDAGNGFAHRPPPVPTQGPLGPSKTNGVRPSGAEPIPKIPWKTPNNRLGIERKKKLSFKRHASNK